MIVDRSSWHVQAAYTLLGSFARLLLPSECDRVVLSLIETQDNDGLKAGIEALKVLPDDAEDGLGFLYFFTASAMQMTQNREVDDRAKGEAERAADAGLQKTSALKNLEEEFEVDQIMPGHWTKGVHYQIQETDTFKVDEICLILRSDGKYLQSFHLLQLNMPGTRLSMFLLPLTIYGRRYMEIRKDQVEYISTTI